MVENRSKVLVLGSGGREHAICEALIHSTEVEKVFFAPGNGVGAADVEKLDTLSSLSLSKDRFPQVLEIINQQEISLVIVGPEQPLVDGIADYLQQELGRNIVFGPSALAARLEGSKAFSKAFMKRNKIPTSSFETFSSKETAQTYLNEVSATGVNEYVIKASGLAAGKGVFLPETHEEATDALAALFKDSSSDVEVVIEEKVSGVEISVFAITDGKDYVILPVIQDYKRRFEQDKGPNTGGMGCNTTKISQNLLDKIKKEVVEPTINGCKTEGFPFLGVIYFGLMISENQDVNVLEYNCRFGDPEAQILMPLLGNDLYGVLKATIEGSLSKVKLDESKLTNKLGVNVVLVADGYPGPRTHPNGQEITFSSGTELKEKFDSFVFHAGTKGSDNKIETSGGRIIGVTVLGNEDEVTAEEVIAACYQEVKCVEFSGKKFREDIGYKLVSSQAQLEQ